MIWGCFSRGNLRKFESTMGRFRYREIVQKNLLQFCKKLGLENVLTFQYNNDPKHTGRSN